MKKVVWVLLATGILFVACKDKQAAAPAAVTVSAVKVLQQDLPWNIEYPAQVAGSLEIQIRAQVGGILQSRLYNEGEFVTEGTQLFQIDDSEYKVALEKAQGSLAQAQAEERRTYRTFKRMKTLRASNAVSQQDYDNALSAYETAQANVKVAQAAVEGAQINLGYTKVTAPISGIVGQAVPSVGSLISPAGESGYLTNMVQINPLYVKFSMPGSQFNQLSQGFLSGQIAFGNMEIGKQKENIQAYKDKDVNDVAVYVEAILPNGEIYPQRGKIIFFDSSENAQTSSIAMKAEFANPKNSRLLMPGQFVRIHLIGATFKNAVLIPSSAVLHTAKELLVYVVDANNAVEARPIEADLQDDMYVVTKGLKEGDIVISEGLSRVRPGQKVIVQLQDFTIAQTKERTAPKADEEKMDQLEQALSDSEAPDAQSLPGVADAQQSADTQPVAGK
ncbi:MAG: efflux RND transporter periplasmic adaptor subunit [Elusimicrobiaceae bacterium]|nr:efflux RND transporter periplasmic adaptor subunit [Elusimicrobiaceae bacterium]